jgi:hypothetical protein
VEELNPWVMMEIAVEGNQSGATRRGEGSEVCISPLSGAQVKLSGPLGQYFVQAWRFSE